MGMDNKEIKLQRMNKFEGLQLSENAYNAVIGLTLLWGILINVLMATVLSPFVLQIDQRVTLVLYLVISLVCIFVINKSGNPVISFLGFTGLAAGMGLLLTSYLTYFSGHTVYSAFLATGVIVVVMMLLSMVNIPCAAPICMSLSI